LLHSEVMKEINAKRECRGKSQCMGWRSLKSLMKDMLVCRFLTTGYRMETCSKICRLGLKNFKFLLLIGRIRMALSAI
jgi:hypothetical protein